MNVLLSQLHSWRSRERLIQLIWGAARWITVVAVVLAIACFVDWLYDMYVDTPFWLRALMTFSQVGLAAGLATVLIVRPWFRTPPIDDLAFRAEKAIPAFGHRLVTAIQLNRPGARTQGMSKVLIAEVTREAGELSVRHNILQLVDYRRLRWTLAVLAPLVVVFGGYAAWKPVMLEVLLKRQTLLSSAEIPRSVQLENVTQAVWPTGAEVTIRYRVTGKYREDSEGKIRVNPDDQPVDNYKLTFEKMIDEDAAYFTCKLPPSSIPFTFTAWLRDGRTHSPGRVDFEPPPQVRTIHSDQLLPFYLGWKPGNSVFFMSAFRRFQERGEVLDALPGSSIRVEAEFNKPVVRAMLIPIERGEGVREVDGKPRQPLILSSDGQAAIWKFATTPKLIGYRIELEDHRGFTSPSPARRGVRMLPDTPPIVELKPEYVRDPDPKGPDANGIPEDYRFDMPLSADGRVMVTYEARSPLGVRAVNLRYRVIPRGEESSSTDDKKIVQHPRDDPKAEVFKRLTLSPVYPDREKLGKFVPELGLFERSGKYGQVELYRHPSPDPESMPGDLVVGGRYNFEVRGLKKKLPDGSDAPLAPGDTVEIYVEAFDKHPGAGRPAGYTEGARLKTIVTEDEAARLIKARDEANERLQDKLRQIEAQQREIFQPKK